MCRKYNISEVTVVVTGATSGIGFETVLNLTKKGAFVIGVGRTRKGAIKLLKKLSRERMPRYAILMRFIVIKTGKGYRPY